MSIRYDTTDRGWMVMVVTGALADDEWRKLLDYMLAGKDSIRGGLVYVHGDDGLTAKQRSELADVIKSMRRGYRTALMTESRVTRGVLTALSWMTKKHDESRAFPLNGFDDAMAFFGATAEEIRAARELAHKLGVFAKPSRAANG